VRSKESPQRLGFNSQFQPARVEFFDSDEVVIVHALNRTVRWCFLMRRDTFLSSVSRCGNWLPKLEPIMERQLSLLVGGGRFERYSIARAKKDRIHKSLCDVVDRQPWDSLFQRSLSHAFTYFISHGKRFAHSGKRLLYQTGDGHTCFLKMEIHLVEIIVFRGVCP
jgi:hypothetical protein